MGVLDARRGLQWRQQPLLSCDCLPCTAHPAPPSPPHSSAPSAAHFPATAAQQQQQQRRTRAEERQAADGRHVHALALVVVGRAVDGLAGERAFGAGLKGDVPVWRRGLRACSKAQAQGTVQDRPRSSMLGMLGGASPLKVCQGGGRLDALLGG